MSFNGSGTFQINSAGQPVVAGTVITAAAFNALTADLATGLSTCMTKDGQTSATANIPMGNNKFTGLSAGTAATDSANLGQVQGNVASLISVAGIDTITGSMSPTLTAYTTGAMYWFVAAGTNTGAVTLNIDGLGAKSVTRDGSTALIAGDIANGQVAVVVYDGTRFQLQKANAFGTLTATTINTTNLTATGTVNLTGATVSNGGSVTTIDINGGTLDGVTIGGASAGAATFTNLTASGTINFTGATVSNGGTVTTVDINGGTIDGAIIGGASAAAGTFTTATVGAGLVGTPSLTTTGDTNTGLYFPAADTIAVATSGTERMRITSGGLVGIGTSSPNSNAVLTNNGNIAIAAPTRNQATSNQVGVWTSDDPADNGRAAITIATVAGGSSSNSYISFTTNNYGVDRAERMRIDSAGNVGIGTSSPGAKLEVAGTFTATGNTINFGGNDATNTIMNVGGVPTGNKFSITDYIGDTTYTDFGLRVGRVNDGANGTSLLQHRGTGSMILDVFDAGSLVAKTSSIERMRIDSSGNVGIGTTGPVGRLDVRGSNSATFALFAGTTKGVRFNIDSNVTNLEGVDNTGVSSYQPLGLGGSLLQFSTGATERMRIDSNGNVRVGTAALATTATDGFLYVPTCAGTPTGTPTAITGLAPIVVNTTNNKLYFYSGGAWRDAGP